MTADERPSVLVVEDERIVAKDIQLTLQELGYDAYAIASSAEEAITEAAKRCPDVVIMDIRIKGKIDGIETADILQKRFSVPVIYLTAHADEATIARAKKTIPCGYLLKPVKAAELRSAVEVTLYRHEMEKRLRARERWFSTTLRSIADAVITVDLGAKITFMNSAAETLTGANADASLGKPVHDVLQLIDPEASEAPPIWDVLRDGRTFEHREGRLVNLATGALHLVDESAAPVVDLRDTLGAVMVFRDVTEQKRLQQQLEFADRLSSLGTMAAGVAHEVNNPLAVIVANAGFVASELEALRLLSSTSPEGRRHEERQDGVTQALADLRSAAARIGRIIADLGSFSRPPAPNNGSMDLVRCVEWALRTTAHEFRQRARVVMSLESVPFVKADEGRVGQVLINLLMNAAQAIVPGDAENNEVRVSTRSAANGRVFVEISDTGAGIADDVLKHIFEPFFTTKPVGVGTGLGLSICHGIVSSIGGSIQVKSQLGKGTTVRVLLRASTSEPPSHGIGAAKRAGFVRGRFLIVDDEEMVLRALARTLRGHDVTCVDSAREALARVREEPPFDLILCDLMMPAMTGIEFYELLLAQKPEVAIRVVFLTGGAVTSHVHDFLQSVQNPRIQKPVEGVKLQTFLHELLVEFGPAGASPGAG